ncbi:hypothetical protein [Sphingopyxis sp. LK2115]|nr:hypothetical protein [Sphingopyxis sp. LK2115]
MPIPETAPRIVRDVEAAHGDAHTPLKAGADNKATSGVIIPL